MDEEKKKALLVEFMETVYQSVLDDTAHFVKEHPEDIQRVWAEWTEQYGFAKCSVAECVKTARHYGRRRAPKKEAAEQKEDDALFSFYESTFDRLHNYLAHLFQMGLRVDMASLVESDEKEEALEGVTVDLLFAAERDQIRSMRKECKLDDENNKFNIQIVAEQTECTLTDALFLKLTEIHEFSAQKRYGLRAFLDRNQFDSDGFVADLEEISQSNIACFVDCEPVLRGMVSFLRTVQCMLTVATLLFYPDTLSDYKKKSR